MGPLPFVYFFFRKHGIFKRVHHQQGILIGSKEQSALQYVPETYLVFVDHDELSVMDVHSLFKSKECLVFFSCHPLVKL